MDKIIKKYSMCRNKKIRVLLLALLGIFLYSSVYSATYYVSTMGNDNNNGSSGSPFRTIAKAASVVSAGDIVLISVGTYTETNITPRVSGTEGNYIVFKPNPSTASVIVRHPGTSVDDLTPVFQLSNRNYIWIEGLQFKDFAYGLASIYISNGNRNVIVNNRFENLGNSQVSAWNGNSIVAIFNGAHNAVYNNYFYNITGDGVNVNSQRSEYNLVCYNTFIDFKGKLRSWGGTWLFSRAIDVQDMSNGNNVIAFNYGEDVVNHIWLDRDGSRNIILRNFGNRGAGNVFNESRCRANVIQENIAVGMNSGYMSSYYSGTNWTYYPRYINNVAYNNTDGFVIHKSVEDEFRNNISYNNTRYSIQFSRAAMDHGPDIFRNNLWFSSSRANSVLYNHIPETTPTQEFTDKNGVLVTLPAYNSTSPGSQVTPAVFQAAMGETNGLSTNPMFVNTSGGPEGFALQASSPARGAGDNGLDLGAYAYYGPSRFGWDPALTLSDIVVYFDEAISRAERGDMHNIVVRLNKAASNTVTVQVVPIAGDAVVGNDFSFVGGSTITFSPGQTSRTISLQIAGNGEYDELVALKLENTTNASVGARCIHAIRFSPGNAASFPTVTLTAPTANQTYTAPATVSIAATATASQGRTIFRVEFFNGTTKLGERTSAPYTYSWTNVAAGTYTITAVAHDNTGAQTTSDPITIRVNVPQGPYGGTAHPIPGTIQFEHFDEGGNGVAYYDDSPGSSVPNPPNFRSDEDVDIENCSDVGGGYNIGYATAGEWLEYTSNVTITGIYTITLRVACNGTGRTVTLSSNGTTIANNVAIPNTEGWQTWQDVTIQDVQLTAGIQQIRITIGATDYVNLNYMTFALQPGENLIANGEFDNGTVGWDMQYNSSTAGTFTVVTDQNMSGVNAARVCPTTPGTANWNVQLRHNAPFQAGKHYEISYIAKADAVRTIGTAVQMEGDPWTTYFEAQQNLTTANQRFSYIFSPTVSDATAKLKFYLGTNTSCVYIDSVVYKELEELPAPPAVITPAGSTTFCDGGSVVLNANTGTGYTYQWLRNNTNITGATSASYTVTQAGSYTVDVTANGLTTTSTATTVTVNAIPAAPSVVSQVVYTAGQTADALTATGTNLLWYTTPTDETGSTSAPIPSTAVVGSTLYYVSQTVNACESERSVITVTIVEADNPKIQLQAGWNLIGSPLSGSVSLEQALSSIWEYVDQVKDMDGFYIKTNQPAFNSLEEVQWGRGYLIKISAPCELMW